jgi:hypothetical protein
MKTSFTQRSVTDFFSFLEMDYGKYYPFMKHFRTINILTLTFVVVPNGFGWYLVIPISKLDLDQVKLVKLAVSSNEKSQGAEYL